MAQFNISGNYFYDNSSVIKEHNEYNLDWGKLEQEFAALKHKTDKEKPQLTPAVEELETVVKEEDRSSIRKVIAKYAVEFSNATFANLASAGILALVKAFSS